MNQEDKIDRMYGAMAYGLGWLSAIYFINAERRVIRWHAFQSIAVFGGLTLSIVAADSIFPLDTRNALVYLLHVVSMSALIFVSVVLWVLLPLQTYRGKPFLVPVFAPLTKKLVGEPPWLDQPVTPPARAAQQFCPKCGSAWAPGMQTCANCGQGLVDVP